LNSETLRLHNFLPESRANGPGRRAVAWLQGCSLGCPGCFNPQTHAFEAGEIVPVRALFERICAPGARIEGVSISGGEPMQQAAPLVSLLRQLRQETALSILVFSGYTLQEIERMPAAAPALAFIDVLVAGRYQAKQRLGAGLVGSTNQTIHLLTSRYSLADLQSAPEAELLITPQGQVVFSGIDPLQ
jgi:anaerobic ribonucleoside-triphosphate reductase activating protein